MKRTYKKVYLEITNRCNLSCSFCAKTQREATLLPKEQFETVLSAVAPYAQRIYPHVLGEPLLHPDFADFLTVCEKYGKKVFVTTNGTLLRERGAVLLASAAVKKVSISLHCFEDNFPHLNPSDYLKEVLDFAQFAEKQGIHTELRLWNTNQTSRMNSLFLEGLAKELVLNEAILYAIRHLQNTKISSKISLNFAEQFSWETDKEERKGFFCYGLRDQFGILVDGTVVPCCMDAAGQIPLGNIYKQPLKQILGSDRAKQLYDGFSARQAKEELCIRCGYARRFHKKENERT